MAGPRVDVSSLNPTQTVEMEIGRLSVRNTYIGTTRYGNPATYYASPDQGWISQKIGVQQLPRPCEVYIETLSRDECYPNNVGFMGGPNNPVMPGTTLSWWHVSNKVDHLAERVKDSYREIVKELNGRPEMLQPFINNLGTSDLFTEDFSRGYKAKVYHSDGNADVPQVRYHCGLNELIAGYKALLGIEEVQFRIHGTTYYPCETMHSVLICPSGADLRNLHVFGGSLENHLGNFPPIAVGPFRTGNERLALTGNRVLVERDGNGHYRFVWRPWCTRSGQGCYQQWDNLTVAFVLPNTIPGKPGPVRLPLPASYHRQNKLVPNDKYDTRFSGELVHVQA